MHLQDGITKVKFIIRKTSRRIQIRKQLKKYDPDPKKIILDPQHWLKKKCIKKDRRIGK
jgi:hypothetical protein